jgi:hypothetical protein
LQKREALGSTDSLNSREDLTNDLDMTNMALTKALEDYRVANEDLVLARQELADAKQKFTTSQQNLTSTKLSLDTSKSDLATSKNDMKKTIRDWNATKKLLGRATSDLVKGRLVVKDYLGIFNQIYYSSIKGDMDKTVGLAGVKTGWQAVKIEENWAIQWEAKKKRIIIEHLKLSGIDDGLEALGQMEKSIQDLDSVKMSTPVKPKKNVKFVGGAGDLEMGGKTQDDTEAKTIWAQGEDHFSPPDFLLPSSVQVELVSDSLKRQLAQTIHRPPPVPSAEWWIAQEGSGGQSLQQQQQQ